MVEEEEGMYLGEDIMIMVDQTCQHVKSTLIYQSNQKYSQIASVQVSYSTG